MKVEDAMMKRRGHLVGSGHLRGIAMKKETMSDEIICIVGGDLGPAPYNSLEQH